MFYLTFDVTYLRWSKECGFLDCFHRPPSRPFFNMIRSLSPFRSTVQVRPN